MATTVYCSARITGPCVRSHSPAANNAGPNQPRGRNTVAEAMRQKPGVTRRAEPKPPAAITWRGDRAEST
jgi:hypothetical protein